MPNDLPIVFTQSRGASYQRCPRLRWWEYECPSSWEQDGTVIARGWEPRKLNLPLSTGGWSHAIAQGLFALHAAVTYRQAVDGLGDAPPFTDASSVIAEAVAGYRSEVSQRGIELGLSLDGAVPEEKFLERTIQEQASLIEAFGWAFNRVRLPRLLEEYDLLDVEREEQTPLSGDVVMQARCDAVLRRKADGRVFVYNLKTSKDPHRKSWQDQWLYDQQMMTEVLAVERRLGERVYGVVVEGFDKGERVTCWWHNLKELREGFSKPPAEGDEKWQRQRSRLLYAYKNDSIPGKPALYDWDGTGKGNAKGWGLVPIYQEQFLDALSQTTLKVTRQTFSPVEYWINWLPEEIVQSCFATLPPIMRLDEQVESKVRQIVSQEKRIRKSWFAVEEGITGYVGEPERLLDEHFPQSSGYQCQYCAFRKVCWESVNPADNPDLFRPRDPNHPALDNEEG